MKGETKMDPLKDLIYQVGRLAFILGEEGLPWLKMADVLRNAIGFKFEPPHEEMNREPDLSREEARELVERCQNFFQKENPP